MRPAAMEARLDEGFPPLRGFPSMQSIILASSSPRRRELLAGLGIEFEVFSPETDESIRDGLPVRRRVVALAEDKARAVSAALPGERRLILAADTLVCLPRRLGKREEALGKPADREDARRMLAALAGRSHEVHTGLALLDPGKGRMASSSSRSWVRFASMSGAEIEAYLDFGDWEGVAGAYRIQGRAALDIERIDGSWSCIVGLPLRELYVMLTKSGFDFGCLHPRSFS
jgi:septum formation protein